MTKKIVLTIRLVKEAQEISSKEIKYDVETELKQILHRIPWAKEIESITVLE